MNKSIQILVVDDSALVRQFMTEVIASQPDMALLATAPDPIVAMTKMQKQWPDVILLDVEMPKMDGYTLTKNIKGDSLLSQIPVVIFSSIVSQDVLHKGKSVGADAQLTKPQIGILIETIRELLK